MKKWFVIIGIIFLSWTITQDSKAVVYETYDLYPSGISAISGKTRANNNGEIAAFEMQDNGSYKMFFYNPVTKVQTHGDYLDASIYVWGINNNRQVVGNADTIGGYGRAVIWDSVYGLTDLGTWKYGSSAASINESGAVVGAGSIDPLQAHAFYWTRSTGAQDIGTLGGLNSEAFGINNIEQVVGSSDTTDGATHAFIWSLGGTMEDLGTLGGRNSRALGINNNGQVFGVSEIDDTTSGMFLWDKDNGMREVFRWSGGDAYNPTAINDNGWIVGSVRNAAMGYSAFVWDPNNGLSILGSGEAYDINNAGQITGVLCDPDWRAVLWNPVPEPSSILALVGGIAGLGGFALRRKRN
jgi:probable HAF family extracellular repeat protein